MKYFITIITITSSLSNIFGQAVKTYSGTFGNGHAVYQYYENHDLERIYNGSFKYKAATQTFNKSKTGTQITKITINGLYKNNLKSGPWEAIEEFTITSLKNSIYTSTCKGNYENGLKQGVWINKENRNDEGKISQETTTYTFSNNIPVGLIQTTYISGAFNKEGDFSEAWKLKIRNTEYLAEFKSNIFVKLIVRDIPTGEILYKYHLKDFKETMYDSATKIINYNSSLKFSVTDVNEIGANSYFGKAIATLEEKDKNDNANEYFTVFYNYVSEKINDFDALLKVVDHGSINHLVRVPKVATLEETSSNGDPNEK